MSPLPLFRKTHFSSLDKKEYFQRRSNFFGQNNMCGNLPFPLLASQIPPPPPPLPKLQLSEHGTAINAYLIFYFLDMDGKT